jgi:hypothetical protein
LRGRFDEHTHAAGILTRISVEYFGIEAQGRSILAGVHLNLDHQIQGPANQSGTANATQRERLTAERKTQ